MVEIERLIGLLLEEPRAAATPAVVDDHPYPNLQSQLRGGGCACTDRAVGKAGDAVGATRHAVIGRLATAIAASPDAHRRLLREFRRADRSATGQCNHAALAECFSHAGQQLAGAQGSPLVISADEVLALCAQSPTRTTVAYQQLLEELNSAVHAQVSSVPHVRDDNATSAGKEAQRRLLTAAPTVPVVPGLPAGGGCASGDGLAEMSGSQVVVVSDLTGSRVRRPNQTR